MISFGHNLPVYPRCSQRGGGKLNEAKKQKLIMRLGKSVPGFSASAGGDEGFPNCDSQSRIFVCGTSVCPDFIKIGEPLLILASKNPLNFITQCAFLSFIYNPILWADNFDSIFQLGHLSYSIRHNTPISFRFSYLRNKKVHLLRRGS